MTRLDHQSRLTAVIPKNKSQRLDREMLAEEYNCQKIGIGGGFGWWLYTDRIRSVIKQYNKYSNTIDDEETSSCERYTLL